MSADAAAVRLQAITDDRAAPPVAQVFATVEAEGIPVPDLYRLLAHAPSELSAWHGLASAMRRPSGLSLEVEAAVILRVAHLTSSARQWRHQVGRARDAGLTARHLEAIRSEGPIPQGVFNEAQATALALVTQLLVEHKVGDDVFAHALHQLGAEDLIKVALKATYFASLARLLSLFDLT